ncbi:hypothetical protein Asppvi_010155 [Aspergillus pseudoviridinutans]|uniref:Uncharacterized protein n=1 Tax=Aspergillus pseudoviridinutans TaxID=1517512 RepID=A0A9P3BH81_9EURO|nr:uncharacterized protein Asppvi_010155 [Aspergillus pseudoviridinutans]GIJ91190.1 hypothetical protein Asppvi_010155 [Aspergillus pseudoviridinutans]
MAKIDAEYLVDGNGPGGCDQPKGRSDRGLCTPAGPKAAVQLDDAVRRVKESTYMGCVENMESIVEAAEEMDWEKRKAIVFAFLSAIFFSVPFVGQLVSGLASLVTIGRIVALMGTVSNVALDIYKVVDDEENAPLAVFNLILAPLALFWTLRE